MSHTHRIYEAARKSMYTAMERETDPHTARREYEEAVEGFNQFLNAKNRGMYHELVGSPNYTSRILPHPHFFLSPALTLACCYL